MGGRRALLAALATATTLAACDAAAATRAPATDDTATRPPATDGAATTRPPETVAPGAGAVRVDPELLAVLPEEILGVALEVAPEAAAEIAADPGLGGSASAVAVALAVDGPEAGDLAVASVVRLRPGVFGAAFFRDWRDTYDAAACAPAGGVGGRAEATIGGRTAYIGSCAAGVRTYHVHLAADGLLVSITSLGERRFGEAIVAGLRPAA